MDTQRVAELIKQIEEEEKMLARTQADFESARRAVMDNEARILALKQSLAAELQSLLPGKRKGKTTMYASAGSGKMQTGIGDAILSTFDDGQPHAIDDVEEHLRARGYTPKKVVVQLSVFVQKGKLRRVSRGVYAKS